MGPGRGAEGLLPSKSRGTFRLSSPCRCPWVPRWRRVQRGRAGPRSHSCWACPSTSAPPSHPAAETLLPSRRLGGGGRRPRPPLGRADFGGGWSGGRGTTPERPAAVAVRAEEGARPRPAPSKPKGEVKDTRLLSRSLSAVKGAVLWEEVSWRPLPSCHPSTSPALLGTACSVFFLTTLFLPVGPELGG